jgi:two-component sensor histidine kinase
MLHLVQLEGRTYSPETIAVMTAAFDAVCRRLSTRMNGSDDLPRTVALAILRRVDQGEHDPTLLADTVCRELDGLNGSPSISPGSNGESGRELSVADVIITPELWFRKSHAPNIVAEEAAMRRLAETMATDPSKTFQVCVDLALELCHADTCGISLRERTAAGDDIFRWIAMAGQLKQHLHGTTPRYFSPCGICVDGSAPLLMQRPELVYKYLDVGPPYHDVLLIPLTEKGSKLEGTIWIVAHNPTRKFDGEDARVMQRLAVFTATALHLANVAQEWKAEASKQELLFRELDHRVMNTLMITAGMLRHQLDDIADPAAREAMERASGRVLAMGRVHQIGAHAATGDLAEVIKGVCTDLVGPDPRFVLKLEAEAVVAPAHKAAIVALIVNELVTNAVKHAFRDGNAGTVSVSLRQTNGNATLSVTDDGAPLAVNGQSSSDGIGLGLVARLADQLAGSLSVETEPKRFTVVFPVHVAHAITDTASNLASP